MNRYIIYITTAILAVTAISCDEPTTLDLRQTPPRIVIEGLLTDKPGYQSVKITRSMDFYASGAAPRVVNATVSVTDDTGQTFPFVHNPRDHSDSAGIYVPVEDLVGAVGRTYTLRVEADGEVYEATDELVGVTPIDTLKFRVNEDQQDDPAEAGKIYEVLLFAREPQDEKNYYLFKYYRNDSLVYFNRTDIYYSDDELLGENIDGVPSPVYYAAHDEARIEIYSLTRNGYVFYNDLASTLNNDGGGMFGPIPAPPRTNLSNGALGFFQVSAVREKQTYIE